MLLVACLSIPAMAISRTHSEMLHLKYVHENKLDTGVIDAFDQIKNLAGGWEGTFQWSGSRTSHGKMDAKYYLTGNGTAVVEDLLMDGKPMMTSVYHLDGPTLRITHYCAAGNQPRLKAGSIDDAKKIIHFEFVDITNLPSPASPHVHGLDMQFLDKDHISLIFDFKKADAESFEHVELTRTKNI